MLSGTKAWTTRNNNNLKPLLLENSPNCNQSYQPD